MEPQHIPDDQLFSYAERAQGKVVIITGRTYPLESKGSTHNA